jgi:hypothetical protein
MGVLFGLGAAFRRALVPAWHRTRIFRHAEGQIDPVLGGQLKRAAASVAGFAFGLLLTWLCLYVFSNAAWRHAGGPTTGGCIDRQDCSWWVAPLLVGYVLLFPVLFGTLNGVAWRRWSVRQWGRWFLGLSLLTVLAHLASYL